MKVMYLAGPMTDGGRLSPEEVMENVHRAEEIAIALMRKGWAVFCPQVMEHAERYCRALGQEPLPYETWMEMDFEFIKRSDALFRIPGQSKGADREVEKAEKLDYPVYYRLDEVPDMRRQPRAVNR